MHQVQSEHVLKQEERSSSTTEKESSPKHENGNHSSQLNERSASVKDEPDDLHHNQSRVGKVVSKSVEEERNASSNAGKDPIVPLQKQSGAESRVPVDGKDQLSIHLYESPKEEPEGLQLRQSSNSAAQAPERCNGKKALSLKAENSSDGLLGAQNFTIQVEKQKLMKSTFMDIGVAQSSLVKVIEKSPVVLNKQPEQPLGASSVALERTEENCEKVLENSVKVPSFNSMVPESRSDEQSSTRSRSCDKVEKLQTRRTSDPAIQGSQGDSTSLPSKIPEKGLDDGYNWRKYGQKLVKGNEFVRSYYRCTFPNCPAKKQVERSYDWCKTDFIYLGDHQHLKPESNCDVPTEGKPPNSSSKVAVDSNSDPGGENQQMASKETLSRSVVASSDSVVRPSSQQDSGKETLARSVVASSDSVKGPASRPDSDNSNDGDPHSKRQKREINSADKLLNKHTNDLQHVQTFSMVGNVDDGYRWRKYGQKIVKGSPYPRSYYRCSNTGCPAKKQVERASHDPNVVVATYEGQHDHVRPPPRT